MKTITIDDKDLAMLVQTTHPIMCRGASQGSEAVPAFVQIGKMPEMSDKNTVSYVLCPRLKAFNENGCIVRKCYEGDPAQYEKFEEGMWKRFDKALNDSMIAASHNCPYFNP